MSEGERKIMGGLLAGGEASGEPVNPPNYYYGTFQGVANYAQPVPLPPPSHPVIGFPQPVPPPAFSVAPPHHYYYNGYQTVPGYAVTGGRPLREPRLACCGLGIGWLLFIAGFLLGGIPWYVGAFLLLCIRLDYREKPGLIACTLAGILSLIAITLGVTKASHSW